MKLSDIEDARQRNTNRNKEASVKEMVGLE